jgi:hypothetical protein
MPARVTSFFLVSHLVILYLKTLLLTPLLVTICGKSSPSLTTSITYPLLAKHSPFAFLASSQVAVQVAAATPTEMTAKNIRTATITHNTNDFFFIFVLLSTLV